MRGEPAPPGSSGPRATTDGGHAVLDLAAATLADFAPQVGTPFALDHPGHAETFTLVAADALPGRGGAARAPFSLLFDGARTDLQFDQQILPLRHAALGALALFLVPVARNPEGTVRYQAVFS